jgi:hypothetical protein
MFQAMQAIQQQHQTRNIDELINLVGNVADMSPRVVATPTMSAENG